MQKRRRCHIKYLLAVRIFFFLIFVACKSPVFFCSYFQSFFLTNNSEEHKIEEEEDVAYYMYICASVKQKNLGFANIII